MNLPHVAAYVDAHHSQPQEARQQRVLDHIARSRSHRALNLHDTQQKETNSQTQTVAGQRFAVQIAQRLDGQIEVGGDQQTRHRHQHAWETGKWN